MVIEKLIEEFERLQKEVVELRDANRVLRLENEELVKKNEYLRDENQRLIKGLEDVGKALREAEKNTPVYI